MLARDRSACLLIWACALVFMVNSLCLISKPFNSPALGSWGAKAERCGN